MAGIDYYAVLYVFDKDGNEKAIMPCFNEDDVLRFGSKYPKVLVKKPNLPPFWLSFKKKWREEYNQRNPIESRDTTPLEWLREPTKDQDDSDTYRGRNNDCAATSEQFYDGWRRPKIKF